MVIPGLWNSAKRCGLAREKTRRHSTGAADAPSFAALFPMKETASRVLRVGLPSGSLQEPTFALFAKAGFNISGASRSYKPAVDDAELMIRLLRAQEISRYVEHGFLDCGLTGKDWIANNSSDVAVLAEMTFSDRKSVV